MCVLYTRSYIGICMCICVNFETNRRDRIIIGMSVTEFLFSGILSASVSTQLHNFFFWQQHQFLIIYEIR